MRLIWSTGDFRLRGVAYQGFPILLDSHLVGIAPANEFLRHHLLRRHRVASHKTWAVYGKSLYDYFGFLETHELTWDCGEVVEVPTPVALYRAYSLFVLNLSRNTVRQRVGLVCQFYRHARDQHWITHLPCSVEKRRTSENVDRDADWVNERNRVLRDLSRYAEALRGTYSAEGVVETA